MYSGVRLCGSKVVCGRLAVLSVLLGVSLAQTGCDPLRDLHAASICHLTLGMTPEKVLETIKRTPDFGQEQAGDIVSAWKLPSGALLTVWFRKKLYVSSVSVDF